MLLSAGCSQIWIFTVRNSSCGKVMFSQACVKNSVHGGGGMPGEGHAWQGECILVKTIVVCDLLNITSRDPSSAVRTRQTLCHQTTLLAFIALSAAQSSAQTHIHSAILVIDTSNNASYNQVHWLVRTPYLSIKASNVSSVWPSCD